MVEVAATIIKEKANADKGANAEPAGGGASASVADKLDNLEKQIQHANTVLKPLPIGWASLSDENPIIRLIGWLITGIAISLGAPFWFDLLSKFVNIRAAGQKPARADVP
jgi:hypothetical protein